jgi:DnaJ-domain-containing protein 1
MTRIIFAAHVVLAFWLSDHTPALAQVSQPSRPAVDNCLFKERPLSTPNLICPAGTPGALWAKPWAGYGDAQGRPPLDCFFPQKGAAPLPRGACPPGSPGVVGTFPSEDVASPRVVGTSPSDDVVRPGIVNTFPSKYDDNAEATDKASGDDPTNLIIVVLGLCFIGLCWRGLVVRRNRAARLLQAEKLRAAEAQQLEAEEAGKRRQAEAQKREAEEAEKRRQAEAQKREAEWQQREAKRQREQTAASKPRQWWDVLGVSSQASLAEITRRYHQVIQLYHPDRVVGLAPEIMRIADQRTKELNAAYVEAKRLRR